MSHPMAVAFFFMATLQKEIGPAEWNYNNLQNLHNSPDNGNANIYRVNTHFFSILKEKVLAD